jgi:hypothetical protein
MSMRRSLELSTCLSAFPLDQAVHSKLLAIHKLREPLADEKL